MIFVILLQTIIANVWEWRWRDEESRHVKQNTVCDVI